MSESLPVGAVLGATFRAWGRGLVPSVAWTAIAWAPAFAWLVMFGWGWPVVGLGLLGDTAAWIVRARPMIAAARGPSAIPAASVRADTALRHLPRALVAMAIVHAPVIAIVAATWYWLHDKHWVYVTLGILPAIVIVPLVALYTYGRWMVVVPVIAERARGLREAEVVARPHHSTILGVLLVIVPIWAGVTVLALTIAASVPGALRWDDAALAICVAWAAASTLRGAMAAAIYVSIVERWTTADLARVFE